MYSFVVTYLLCRVLQLVLRDGIRVTEESEESGLDLSEHAEVGRSFSER